MSGEEVRPRVVIPRPLGVRVALYEWLVANPEHCRALAGPDGKVAWAAREAVYAARVRSRQSGASGLVKGARAVLAAATGVDPSGTAEWVVASPWEARNPLRPADDGTPLPKVVDAPCPLAPLRPVTVVPPGVEAIVAAPAACPTCAALLAAAERGWVVLSGPGVDQDGWIAEMIPKGRANIIDGGERPTPLEALIATDRVVAELDEDDASNGEEG